MSYSDECNKCGGELHIIEGIRYDSDDMRDARYCAECHTLFGCHAHGLSIQKEGVDMSELAIQNKLLRNTLKTILRLYPQSPARGKPMPQTREFWEKRALMDQQLILEQRSRISSLKQQCDRLGAKLESTKIKLIHAQRELSRKEKK